MIENQIMIATIIILTLMFVGVVYNAYLHGKPKEGKHDFWVHFVAFIIYMLLYYCAGLFDKFFK